MKKFLAVLLCGFCAASLFARPATVKATNLNVRIRNNTSCDVIAKLQKGDKVEVISINAPWAKIVAPANSNVFVSAQFLDKDGVTTSNVNLRCGAGANYQSYGIIPAGTRLTVIKEAANGWIQVKPLSTMFAYVSSAYLALEDQIQTSADTPKNPETPTTTSANQNKSAKVVTMSDEYREIYENNKAHYFIEDSKVENFSAEGVFSPCSRSEENNLIFYGIKNAQTHADYFLIGEFPKYFEGQNVMVKGTKYEIKGWIKHVIVVDEIKIIEKK